MATTSVRIHMLRLVSVVGKVQSVNFVLCDNISLDLRVVSSPVGGPGQEQGGSAPSPSGVHSWQSDEPKLKKKQK